MILKDGMKHACRSCITGHRSSKCVHNDRELFPIAKKGRPSSQCKNCKNSEAHTAGACDCQKKRKTKHKSEAHVDHFASGSGHSLTTGPAPSSGRRERRESFSSVTGSSYPPSEENYSHGRSMIAGFPSGVTTRPHTPLDVSKFNQHTFPFQPDSGEHRERGHPHATAGYEVGIDRETYYSDAVPAGLSATAVDSRPATAADEEVPWWYTATYSPNTLQQYTSSVLPLQDSAHEALGQSHHLQAELPDFAHFTSQPSPYYLENTPGSGSHAAAVGDAPSFVWHSNATSYRDYMAMQHQQHGGVAQHSEGGDSGLKQTHQHTVQQESFASRHTHPSSLQQGQGHHIPSSAHHSQYPTQIRQQYKQEHEQHHQYRQHDHQQQVQHRQHSQDSQIYHELPSLHHHHSLPYLSTDAAGNRSPLPGPVPPHSAPLPHAHLREDDSNGRPASWGPHRQSYAHYLLPPMEHSRRHEAGHRHQHAFNEDVWTGPAPGLTYESGQSRFTSSESVLGLKHLRTPVQSNANIGLPDVAGRYATKDDTSASPDAHLRERRSQSFEQVLEKASGTPLNLRIPEDRKRRRPLEAIVTSD